MVASPSILHHNQQQQQKQFHSPTVVAFSSNNNMNTLCNYTSSSNTSIDLTQMSSSFPPQHSPKQLSGGTSCCNESTSTIQPIMYPSNTMYNSPPLPNIQQQQFHSPEGFNMGTISSWQVDETCSTSRIPGKIRSRCDPKCFFHWKNQKMTVDDNLLFPLSQNLFHIVDCKKITKKHKTSLSHNQHGACSSSSSTQQHHAHHQCKITFDDSLSYPPHHKSNVNNSMFEFVPFKLESLPKDYSLSYMSSNNSNHSKKKQNFYASHSTTTTTLHHQTSLEELNHRLKEENTTPHHQLPKQSLQIKVNSNVVQVGELNFQSNSDQNSPSQELSPKSSRTRIFSIKELLN